MTTRNAKSLVAAALASTAAVAPALAAPVRDGRQVAVVAQSCSTERAIETAVAATPLTYEQEVTHVDVRWEAQTGDYVVTVFSIYGTSWTVWVNAATGVAWQVV